MVERIENFRQSLIKRTEKTDTRQDIQHHDPEFFKKNDEPQSEGFKDPYEDLTDVSIASLIAFLEGLLTRIDGFQTIEKAPNTEDQVIESHTIEVRPPTTPQTAQAIQAYQTRAIITEPPHSPAEIKLPENASALDKAAADLDDAEIKSVMRDLRQLMDRGIDHLTLTRGDSFLGSIKNAIAAL